LTIYVVLLVLYILLSSAFCHLEIKRIYIYIRIQTAVILQWVKSIPWRWTYKDTDR